MLSNHLSGDSRLRPCFKIVHKETQFVIEDIQLGQLYVNIE